MDTTRPTLLLRVRHRDDQSAWKEFFDLYFPLLSRYARHRGLAQDQADEIAQDCMKVLAETMGSFDYSRDRGTFKGYLFTLVVRRIGDTLRRKRPQQAGTRVFEDLAETEPSPDERWEANWLRSHLLFCLQRIENEYTDSTIAAFKLHVLDEWSVEKVCEALKLSANQVYLAKSRVTQRLRREMTELVGDIV